MEVEFGVAWSLKVLSGLFGGLEKAGRELILRCGLEVWGLTQFEVFLVKLPQVERRTGFFLITGLLRSWWSLTLLGEGGNLSCGFE